MLCFELCYRSGILLLLLSILTTSAPAQGFWNETFEDDEIPIVWQNSGTNNGLARWSWTTDPAAGFRDPGLADFASPSATNGYYYFDSDKNWLAPHDVRLNQAAAPANCSGKTNVHLRFFTQFVYFNPDNTPAQLGVSTDGINFTYKNLFGGLPANLSYHDWVDVDLDEADGQPQVWLRFRWQGNYEYHWKIDDLSLYVPDPENADSCATAVDINPQFGQTPNEPQYTALFDNTTATASPSDPEVSCWNEAGPGGLDILNTTMWFSFTGDGGTYDIQTAPCNASNYIGTAQGSDGDTQMLVYAGSDCSDLTPIVCNDDLFADGLPDWRAGVTLETTPGQHYYLLIDAFEIQGLVATGEFCIQVTQLETIPCSQGQVGTFGLEQEGLLCQGENLIDFLNPDAGSFQLPTTGPQAGMAWCFSQEPIPPNTWPGTIPGIASTPFGPEVNTPFLINNGMTLNYGKYYLTPVVLGGGTLINPNSQPYVFNVDPSGGCFFVGESLPLVLLPALSPLTAASQVTHATLPPGVNGAITLSVNGGSGAYLNDAAQYQFDWNTGQTTKDIAGLSAGTYTVTISDRSGCVAPIVLNAVVTETVGSNDPDIVQKLELRPNPTSGLLQVELTLKSAASIRLELFNAVGQLIRSADLGSQKAITTTLDLRDFSNGLYLLQLQLDGKTAVRQVVLQR